MADLDSAGHRHGLTTLRAGVALEHFGCLDRAICGEVAAANKVSDVMSCSIRSGDPRSAVHDAGIDEITNPRRRGGAKRLRADVTLDERRVLFEIGIGEWRGFCRSNLRFDSFEIDFSVSWNSDGERLDGAIGMNKIQHHVFQRVVGRPRPVGALSGVGGIEMFDERIDGRCIRRIDDGCRRVLNRGHWSCRHEYGLGVCCVTA